MRPGGFQHDINFFFGNAGIRAQDVPAGAFRDGNHCRRFLHGAWDKRLKYPAVFRQEQVGMDLERNIMHRSHDRAGSAEQRDVVLGMRDINSIGFERFRERRQHPERVIGRSWDLPPPEVRAEAGRLAFHGSAQIQHILVDGVYRRQAAEKAAPVGPVASEAAR